VTLRKCLFASLTYAISPRSFCRLWRSRALFYSTLFLWYFIWILSLFYLSH